MKRVFFPTLCGAAWLSLCALALQAQAQSGSSPAGSSNGTAGVQGSHRRGEPSGPERHAREIIVRFDKDGDRALNAEELAAFFESVEARAAGRAASLPPAGALNSSAAAKPPGASPRAGYGTPQVHAARAIEKFDKNGDGKLQADELVALLVALREHAMQGRTPGAGPAGRPSAPGAKP